MQYDYDVSGETPDVRVVPRAKWGAVPPLFTEPLALPAERLLFITTNTQRCMGRAECYKACRTIQKYFMEEKGMPDLPYSFLIGGDLRVYEGRGWGVMIRRRDMEDWVDERVVFGLITNDLLNDKRQDKMMEKAYDLMYYAFNNEYLINFDRIGQQDEEAKRNEEKALHEEIYKEAKKEAGEDIANFMKEKHGKEKENKEWQKDINYVDDLHYQTAKVPEFQGDPKDLKDIMKDNQAYFDSLDAKRSDLFDDSSDIDTDEIVMGGSDEEWEEAKKAPL